MTFGIRPRITYANAMATIAVFIALGGGAYAASRAFVRTDGVVHACVGSRGQLRVIHARGRCRKHEQSISFNERGRVGASGVNGGQGAPGIPGKPGSDASFAGAHAGGVLTGQYPSPTLAPGAVGSASIASQAVGTSQLADGSVDVNKLGLVPVEMESALDSTSPKTVQISCPAGKVPIGGGGGITDGSTTLNGVAALSFDGPRISVVGSAFVVSAYEPAPTATNWEIEAYAFCANGT